MKPFLLLFLFLLSPFLLAAEGIDLSLPNGDELSLENYPAQGRTLVIWLPSENGFGPGHGEIAEGLSRLGIDVWVVHLHESLMLPPGRLSLGDVRASELLPLLERAASEGFEKIYLMSSGRGARLALQLAYLWQQHKPQQQRRLAGLILFTPHLLGEKVVIGETAGYQLIADYSNLPIYMIMPEYSTKYARSREIAERLRRGGSPVFVHLMKNIRGGFQARADEDLKPVDIRMRQRLPDLLAKAVRLLGQTRSAPLKPGWRDRDATERSSFRAPKLYPIAAELPPPLRLRTLDGRVVDLDDLRGKVVLVNFWATWCAPCIEEIPSLTRLTKRMKGKPFVVLAVNIGEQPEAIRRFLQRIPVNFDILLDRESQAVRDWKVYAYPSNYIVDREGRLRYGYRGALAWDAPEIVQTIETLF